MKTKNYSCLGFVLGNLFALAQIGFAQGTAFTYQGRLNDGANTANGIYDLRFTIYDTLTAGTSVAGPLTNSTVAVSNGLFTVALDFGGAVFTGAARWLEIGVRPNGSAAAYTALQPRQPLTPSPYAIRAERAGTATTVAPGGVVNSSILVASVSLDKLAAGVLHPSNFPPNSVTSTQLSDVIALGSSNAIGQLDIFGTDAAPAITLSGDTSRISTFGSDGRERTRLWGPGTSWGELQLLNNLSNNALAAWLTANGSLGGALVLRDTNALNRAFLRGGNAGGTLQLFGDGGDRIQLDSSSNSWFSAGHFGLGHSAPTHPLDVEGVSRHRVNPFNHLLLSGFFDDAQIDFVKNSTNPVPSGRIEFNGYSHPDAHGASIRFYTREFADTNVLLRMVIAENGRVGLGTDTPQALLDVAGTVRASAFESAGTALMLSTTDNQPLEFKVNGARALRLEPSAFSPNVIGGFSGNAASAGVNGAAIGGGGDATRPNAVTGDFGTVSGGAGNSATGSATVGGGIENVAGAFGSTIAGGNRNRIETPAFNAAIGGGQSNVIRANALQAAIVGGFNNLIGSNAQSASIGGGFNNVVGTNAFYGVVAGGTANRIGLGSFGAFIGGGQSNVVGNSAALAMIPGGDANEARGFTSLAAGTRAQALHSGAFVWADRSAPATPFASTGNDQFLIRANGGVGIGTPSPLGALHLVGPVGAPPAGTIPANNGLALGLQSTSGYKWIQSYGGPLVLNPAGNNVGIGKTNPATALDVNGTVTATTFNPPSDRQLKENFQRVNPRDVLEKVAGLDITRWNFKGDAATAHLGPVAQDFHAAFGLGTDNKHIATVDADGVALAAIQGLNQKVEAGSQKSEVRIQKLEAENTELKQRLAALEKIILGQQSN